MVCQIFNRNRLTIRKYIYKSNYNSAVQDSVFNQSYVHLFPTLMVQYQLSENHNLSMAYSRRIVRPNYRNMNPFVEVRDQFYMNKEIPN